jgi:molybdopterin-guanine dinucleotide biosynthesis protein B
VKDTPIISIVGRKGSGKTRLIERLVRDLKDEGYRTAVLKHIHHGDFEIDIEGKDTWRYSEAGAQIILGISSTKMFLVKRLEDYPNVRRIIRDISGEVDIVLLEGFSQMTGSWEETYKVIIPRDEAEVDELLNIVKQPILGIYSEKPLDIYGHVKTLNYNSLKKEVLDLIKG